MLLSFIQVSVHDPLKSVDQLGRVEVDEQAELLVGQLQIRQKLGGMNGMKLFNSLDFHDDQVFNKQVDAQIVSQSLPTINDGHGDLF